MAGGNLIKAKKNGGFSTRGMFPCSKCRKEFQGKDQARDHENNCKAKVKEEQNKAKQQKGNQSKGKK